MQYLTLVISLLNLLPNFTLIFALNYHHNNQQLFIQSSNNWLQNHSIVKRYNRDARFLPRRRPRPYKSLVAALRRDFVVQHPKNKDQIDPCAAQGVRSMAIIAKDIAQIYGGKKQAIISAPCPFSKGNTDNVNYDKRPILIPATPKPLPVFCVDNHEFCCFWASLGHCDSNLYWMRVNCQKACGTCGCRDDPQNCQVQLGSCGIVQTFMPPQITTPFVPIVVATTPETTVRTYPATTTTLKTSIVTIATTVPEEKPTTPCPSKLTSPKPDIGPTPGPVAPTPCPHSGKSCEDAHPLCCFWASLGQCDSNLYWMRPQCQRACGTCGCDPMNAENCKVNLGSCGVQENDHTEPITAKIDTVTMEPSTTTLAGSVGQSSTSLVTDSTCSDNHDLCCFWASIGHCDYNMYYMRLKCQKACGTCGCSSDKVESCKVALGSCTAEENGQTVPTSATDLVTQVPVDVTKPNTGCEDSHEFCCFWASLGHCDSNLLWMRPNCQKACGTCGCTFEKATECTVKLGACGEVVETTKVSLISSSETTTLTPLAPAPTVPQPIDDKCEDADDLCCFWASAGHCDSNLFYMRPNCQKACGTCGCTYEKATECKVNLGSCGEIGKTDLTTTLAPPMTYAPPSFTSTLLPPPPKPTESSQQGECVDKNELCCFWAGIGHCDSNLYWMRPNCQKSCGTCGCKSELADQCVVTPTDCSKGATLAPPATSTRSYGGRAVSTDSAIPATQSMTPDIFTVAPLITNPPPKPCADENELCCFWASENQCETNPFWMRVHCAVSCGSCGCTTLNALGCAVQVSEFCAVQKKPDTQSSSTPMPDLIAPPGPPSGMDETAPPPITVAPPSDQSGTTAAKLVPPPPPPKPDGFKTPSPWRLTSPPAFPDAYLPKLPDVYGSLNKPVGFASIGKPGRNLPEMKYGALAHANAPA